MSNRLAGGIKAGSTNYTTDIVLRSATDNTEITGKVAADLTATYWRPDAASVAIVLSDLAALTDPWSAGGVKEVEATAMPGTYRLDLPDAALVAGVDWVELNVFASGSFVFKERFALETVGAAEVLGAVVGLGAVPTAAAVATAVHETVMVESYAADGAQMTLAQALYLVQQFLFERTLSGTTLTIKRLDGVTTAAVVTTNSAPNPTSYTRSA